MDSKKIKVIMDHHTYKFAVIIKKNGPLRIAMDAFCEKTGLDLGSLRFMTSDHERIMPGKTALNMGIEDGDSIEIFGEQDGGGNEK